jgi:SNF2 family DNA or RNA helicase
VREYMPKLARPVKVFVELDAEGTRVYNRIAADLLADLADLAKKKRGSFDLLKHYAGGSADAEAQGRVMSKISCARMLLTHPDQLIGSGELYLAARDVFDEDPDAWPTVKKILKGKEVRVPKPLPGSQYAAQLLEEGELDGLDESPKLDELCLDIDELLAANDRNKIVVFSYHKLALRIIEARYPRISVRYDGDMTLKRRNSEKHRFKTDPAIRLFLSSDAGGLGVDLPEANILCQLDVPFTAGLVTQRNARVRRANLDFHDTVYTRTYLVEGSLEEYYAMLTAQKQRVAHAMRTGRGTTKGGITMSAATLGSFLRENQV